MLIKHKAVFTLFPIQILAFLICRRNLKNVINQMKAIEQYFPVVLFIILYKVVLTFELEPLLFSFKIWCNWLLFHYWTWEVLALQGIIDCHLFLGCYKELGYCFRWCGFLLKSDCSSGKNVLSSVHLNACQSLSSYAFCRQIDFLLSV